MVVFMLKPPDPIRMSESPFRVTASTIYDIRHLFILYTLILLKQIGPAPEVNDITPGVGLIALAVDVRSLKMKRYMLE